MSFFDKFKKNKKEQKEKMTTLEQVRKAYEDLSEDDKKSFHQSIADRVHESIAAQERADGNEDKQSAEDREHEALGAEHADGKDDVEELHETDEGKGKETVEEAEEKAEKREEEREDDKTDGVDKFEAFMAHFDSKMDELFAKLANAGNATAEKTAEEAAEEIYGLGNGVFQGSDENVPKTKMSNKEIADFMQKIKK